MANPYQPPDDLNLGQPSKPDLAVWVHGYVGLRLVAVVVVAAVTWYVEGSESGTQFGRHMWAMLLWILLGTLAAVGVAFRIRRAKHLLVAHLVCTAAVELYAFIEMMGLEITGPNRDAVFEYGWVYFGMAVWDLGWAALFQFSPSLKAALNR